jgi:hypothetical protein
MEHHGIIAAVVSAAVAFGATAGWVSAAAQGPELKLEKGSHISLIGNTLAERMQHDGWLEAAVQSRFPGQELVFRDLGFSGDEVDKRIRVDGFGSPDEWLTNTDTDVIFAFFGYNESFAGQAGVEQFKYNLENFIKHTQSQKYNHKSAPRLVLFSSIAQEKLPGPNFPDNAANNANIKLYTEATAEVARKDGVSFVDLFAPTLDLYAKGGKPLTIDCMHLNADGDRQVADIIVRDLFPDAKASGDDASLEKLREAVRDKNHYFFWRYQTNDGYNVYGGRSHEIYSGVTNRVVLQREMEVLDAMTANRDKRIWSLAQGSDIQVSDDNTPPFIPAKSNSPGPFTYLDPEEAIKHMKLAPHLKVNLVTSEKQFPDMANPVQLTFDGKGRLVVAVWPTYPHWKPKTKMQDKILILDLKDGKAEKETVFADGLNGPTGLACWQGGIFVGQAPDLLYLKDTTGGDHANFVERVAQGMSLADTHHALNSFAFDPGGALYFQEGTFNQSQVETTHGEERCSNAGVFRYVPLTHDFDVYVSYGFANPHGHVFNSWGQDFVTDGTGNVNYFATGFSGHVDYPNKHGGMQPYFHQRVRPCAGTGIISSAAFPAQMQGNLMTCNVITFQGILQHKFTEDGSGYVGKEVEPIVQSDDPNFRPSSACIGPDGAIYFLDWQNALIGHLQHHIRDPDRDHTHGRIYRITYDGMAPVMPEKVAGEPVDHLLDLLKSPIDGVRGQAKIELSNHDAQEVIPALEKWIAGLDKNDKAYQHNLMEGLWMYQWQNVVNEALLEQMLRSPDYHARAAATRVLCYWRDRVKDPLKLLKVQADDDNPQVRLEAVRACSFFKTPQAADVALETANKPQDYYLKYTLDETLKTLDKYSK